LYVHNTAYFQDQQVKYKVKCIASPNYEYISTIWDILKSVQRRPESVRRHTDTDLSHTIAGQEDNAGTTAHTGTSVFALGWQL